MGVLNKKRHLSIFVFLLLFLTACDNQTEDNYHSAIQEGLDALVSEEYEKAGAYFEIALEEKDGDERAQALLKQTNNLNKAIIFYNQQEFEKASKNAEEVSAIANGSDSLVKIANDLLEEIAELNITTNNYQKLYDDADSLLASESPDEALVKIEELLTADKITLEYNEKIKQKAEVLKEEIKNALGEISEQKALEEEEARIAKEKEDILQQQDNALDAYNNLDTSLKVLLAATTVDERATSPGLMGYYLNYNFDQDYLFVQVTSGAGSGHPVYMLKYDSDYITPIEGVVAMGAMGYDFADVDTNPVSKVDLYNRYLNAKDAYDSAISNIMESPYINMDNYQKMYESVGQQ